jgi:hypothetical protein
MEVNIKIEELREKKNETHDTYFDSLDTEVPRPADRSPVIITEENTRKTLAL